jgi:hypothetical protein
VADLSLSLHAGIVSELRAQRDRRSDSDVDLTNGRRIARFGDGSLYRFQLSSAPPAAEVASSTLIVGDASHRAHVLCSTRTWVVLRVEGLDAMSIVEAVLREDATFLLARLAEVIGGDVAPPDRFDAARADVLLQPGAPCDTLRLGQDEAVAAAQVQRRVFLWGPPGTGKTTTAARIVEGWLGAGLRVLLVSHTNAAVDTAFLRAVARIPQHVEDDVLLRIGTLTGAIGGDLAPHCTVAGVLRRRGSSAAETVTRLTEVRQQLTGALIAEADEEAAAVVATTLAETDARLKGAREQLVAEQDSVVAHARLVACTVYQLYTGTISGDDFDAVLIDEASMVPLPLTWLAAGFSRRHLVVAGDFRQLPPIVASEEGVAKDWYGRSAFEAAGVDVDIKAGRHRDDVIALDEQHRMRPDIAEVVSACFYEPHGLRLRTLPARLAAACTDGDVLPGLSLVDLSDLRSWAVTPHGGLGTGRFNVMSAQVAFALSTAFRADGAVAAGDIGLVGPYRAQATLLGAADSDAAERGAQEPGLAATVHRFQGGERHAVVYDMTGAHRGSVGRFFAMDEKDTASRLVNVACSRAQDHLVVVADVDKLLTEDLPVPIATMLRRLRDHAPRLDFARHPAFVWCGAAGDATDPRRVGHGCRRSDGVDRARQQRTRSRGIGSAPACSGRSSSPRCASAAAGG